MYYAHFGLKQPPFKITPNTEFFFSGGNRGAVLDALIFAIRNGEGIIKVVGEVGSGKTMLCRMLQTLLPENVESVYLANPSVAPEDVLHAIAFELQLKLPKNADRLQVMQALQAYLLDRHAAGRQVVIFVEEAQGMPLATLEEIRLLTNLETKHDKLLQIVLFGQPELDINLNDTQIRQLRERITHSFNLGPLEEEDVGSYLIFRLRAAGYYGPHLFSKAAIRMISRYSQGLVRRVNILADKSLLSAFSDNVYEVTPKHVRAAINDSEFGAEQVKRQSSLKMYLAAGVILLAGLAIGYLVNQWQRTVPVAIAEPVAANAGEPAQQASALIAAEAPVPAPLPEEAVETAAGSQAEDILERRLAVTKHWLNQQPESTVSIQLMGASNDDQLRQQLESLAAKVEIDNVYVYRTTVTGKPFITVLYGTYIDRREAVRALQQLPEALRSYRPQLRTTGGILQEIKHLQ
ncbi:hypothetical protein MTYP_02107 [Methylophilaceae bacterium]|nr:hypothetical protein MTYP_02107 [Methylophilaceae bacterium]